MENEKFDQREYIKKYNKETYKKYSIYVRREKAKLFEDFCEKTGNKKSKIFNDLINELLIENNVSLK